MKIIGIIFFIIAACAYCAFWYIAIPYFETHTLLFVLFVVALTHPLAGFAIYNWSKFHD